MSGTSMDGIDMALLDTDGEHRIVPGPWRSQPYPEDLRVELLSLKPSDPPFERLQARVTDLQAAAVRALCGQAGIAESTLDCVGFHGQTIWHDPSHQLTVQLGDGARMARDLGCVVVNRFRDNDLAHGGEGAPLAPAYHRALAMAANLPLPTGIVNIGGVSNITLIAEDGMFACDCGPGNALVDDWVRRRTGLSYDESGRLAGTGRVHSGKLSELLNHPFFRRTGARSLDRNAFSIGSLHGLATEDGAATLVAFTVEAIARCVEQQSYRARQWIVVGGGRHNLVMVDQLRTRLAVPLRTAEDLHWAGDALEAQAFAYLAVRSLRGLPLSWPSTTGVSEPVTGGVHHRPD
jgi:anhydro-N-acetylmuramic acid kinase